MAPTQTASHVNEVEARVIAAQVALLASIAVVAREPWLVGAISADFLLRILAGPRYSPLARLARHVVLPAMRRPERPVPAAPKRFAQILGFSLTVVSLFFGVALNIPAIPLVAAAAISVLATLEAAFALCVACTLYNAMVSVGLIAAPRCEACEDIRSRR